MKRFFGKDTYFYWFFVQMQLGITPPISTNGPTDNDRLLTDQLEKVLKDHGMFEPESEARKRYISSRQ